jgi:hypothetical protein
VQMFANLTAGENRALFTKLAGAGNAIDKLTGTLMGCQQHAGTFVTYVDIWGEINAIRHDLNDQRAVCSVTRDEAIRRIAGLGYGRDNAETRILHAAFSGSWTHPAGALTVVWDAQTDRYAVTEEDSEKIAELYADAAAEVIR